MEQAVEEEVPVLPEEPEVDHDGVEHNLHRMPGIKWR